MTPQQKELARHALGLPNKRKTSYRNYFMTGSGSTDYPIWMGMVEQGDALSGAHAFSDDMCFWLTPQGAIGALSSGEMLRFDEFNR